MTHLEMTEEMVKRNGNIHSSQINQQAQKHPGFED
jgi:hypothetical protein